MLVTKCFNQVITLGLSGSYLPRLGLSLLPSWESGQTCLKKRRPSLKRTSGTRRPRQLASRASATATQRHPTSHPCMHVASSVYAGVASPRHGSRHPVMIENRNLTSQGEAAKSLHEHAVKAIDRLHVLCGLNNKQDVCTFLLLWMSSSERFGGWVWIGMRYRIKTLVPI